MHFLYYSVIVVLGQRLCDNGTLPFSLQQRVEVAIQLQNDTGLPILFSGGTTQPLYPHQSEASAMLQYAQNSSIVGDYYLEEKARNSLENALFTFNILKNLTQIISIPTLIVVTNEFHLPRSLRIFKHVFRSTSITISGKSAWSGYCRNNTRHVSQQISDPHQPSMEDVFESEVRSVLGLNEYLQKYNLPSIPDDVIDSLVWEILDTSLINDDNNNNSTEI
jgi:hypothetical protein